MCYSLLCFAQHLLRVKVQDMKKSNITLLLIYENWLVPFILTAYLPSSSLEMGAVRI